MTRGSFFQRTALTVIVVPVLAAWLGACSMANFPGYRPGGVQLSAAAAPQPAKRPSVRPEVVDDFVPMAFADEPRSSGNVDGLISKYAMVYDVPESLIRRVVQRESSFNPRARNGPYYGLMQIRHDTARSMGYGGSASGLLDAET